MPFIWNEETMATGVPSVDGQHRELVARYNRFHDALLEARGRDDLLEVLGFLIAYAKVHFPQEEALMTQHNCPAAEPNRLAHRELVETLTQIEDQLRIRGTTIGAAVDVESKLANWLRTHLCTVDIKLRETAASRYFGQKRT